MVSPEIAQMFDRVEQRARQLYDGVRGGRVGALMAAASYEAFAGGPAPYAARARNQRGLLFRCAAQEAGLEGADVDVELSHRIDALSELIKSRAQGNGDRLAADDVYVGMARQELEESLPHAKNLLSMMATDTDPAQADALNRLRRLVAKADQMLANFPAPSLE
jgi:hypothetical protein